MNSPFPEIDPYLEAQGLWRDLHAPLITGRPAAGQGLLSTDAVPSTASGRAGGLRLSLLASKA